MHKRLSAVVVALALTFTVGACEKRDPYAGLTPAGRSYLRALEFATHVERLRATYYAIAIEEARKRPARGSVWDRLAVCESGGRWNLNIGTYDGGLQFHPGTWRGAGGGQFAPYAWQATREQQIVVAERVLASQGWGAWPACSRKLGLR